MRLTKYDPDIYVEVRTMKLVVHEYFFFLFWTMYLDYAGE